MTRTQGFFIVVIALLWARDVGLIGTAAGLVVIGLMILDNFIEASAERKRDKR